MMKTIPRLFCGCDVVVVVVGDVGVYDMIDAGQTDIDTEWILAARTRPDRRSIKHHHL
jgi:hypothetical protein